MSGHTNVVTVNRMTEAVFARDVDALREIFTDDMTFHVRGPLPRPGDHAGVEGFLGALGAIFELTGGDVRISQLALLAEGDWATEWEHAVLGRNGRTLEAKNAFVYRFEAGRIAEMWMICTAPAGSEAFWN